MYRVTAHINTAMCAVMRSHGRDRALSVFCVYHREEFQRKTQRIATRSQMTFHCHSRYHVDTTLI